MRCSASQIATGELCLRKWGWEKIDKIPGKSNKYAQFGTDTHAVAADWLSKRIPPDVSTLPGETAAALIPHLPPPQDVNPKLVEVNFRIEVAGIEFVGFVDLFHTPPGGLPTVYDHKTTGDLRWAKTPDELVTDPQATLYALWGMIDQRVDVVGAQWTYATRAPRPKAHPVRRRLTRAEISPRLDRTGQTALDMQAIHASGCSAIEIPYDASGCEAFGGCPFQDLCKLTPQERIQSVMTQGEAKESFLARLRGRQTGGEALAPHPPPAAAVPVNPPVPAAPAAPAASAPEAPAAAPSPPEAAPTLPKKRKRRTKAEMAAARAAEAAAKAGTAPEAPAPEAPAPVEPPAAPPAQVPPPAPEAVESGREPAPRLHNGGGFVLYVDCVPVKTPPDMDRPELLSGRIAHIMAELQRAHGVSHYKVIDFGKGPGIFSAALVQDLRERPPASGAICMSTASTEARDAHAALESAATVVIHGTK